jgi:hypothetical protein
MVWGGLTGTLSDQTDLNDALANKLDAQPYAQIPIVGVTNNVPFITANDGTRTASLTFVSGALRLQNSSGLVNVNGTTGVNLQYNAGTKLAVTSTGATVTGTLNATTGLQVNGVAVGTPVVYTASVSGTTTVDCTGYDVLRLTLTGNLTLTLSNMVDGKSYKIILIQDGTGSRIVTLDGMFKFGTDVTAYTATTTASKRDLLGVWSDGTNAYVIGAAKGY